MSDPGKSHRASGKKATDDLSEGESESGTPPSKKRPRSGDAMGVAKAAPLEEPLGAEDLAKMSRSERKRHREKKRRSDVNKGFDELMALLLEIDPNVRAEAEDRAMRGQFKGGTSGSQEENLLSRVELISRTVEVLRRIHNENEERKRIIASLTQQTRGSAMSGAFGMRTPAGSFGQDLPVSATAEEVASLLPPFSRSSPDDIALRAAAEASQLYSQSLIDRLSSFGPASQRDLLAQSQRSQPNLLGLPAHMGGGLGSQDSLGFSGRLPNTDIARQLANLSAMDNRQLFGSALSGQLGLAQARGGLSNQQYEYLQLLRERNQPSESSRYRRGEDSETSRFTQGSADRSGRGPEY